jgi:F420-non-reducing hydrogenase large subunit
VDFGRGGGALTTVTIDPVTRIEGHARVLFDVDSQNKVLDARLIVNELRGFERLLVGMEADRMPLITARICGVCPSAHHLAAVNALDTLVDEPPPQAAKLLRELLYMGHLIHSHTLSLFVLQGPDLILGLSAKARSKNIVGLVSKHPELAQKALRLRSLGQKINEMVGGRGIHPVTCVPGGITFQLDHERRIKLRDWAKEARTLALDLVSQARDALLRLGEQHPEVAQDWYVPSYQVATVESGEPRFCGGPIQVRDDRGQIVKTFQVADYADHFVEVTQSDSYLKPVFFKTKTTEHVCRVGPLARINCIERMGTRAADEELARFRSAFQRPCQLTIMQTWARAIELLYACERAVEVLDAPALSGSTRIEVRMREGRAVGSVEAPRGTLIHDYDVDDRGIISRANLLVATQYNYAAINRSLLHAIGERVPESKDADILDAVEFSIRCYDPCLSCATHALGKMPLVIDLRCNGTVLRTIRRSS